MAVNFPSTLVQPSAPHPSNYSAAQSVNAALPFVLGWDPFSGGTAADCIYVEIYGGLFATPNVGQTGALNGTTTSVTIPGETFQTNRSYTGCVSFYHYVLLTNGTSDIYLAYRSSTTEFGLNTTSVAGSLMINACWANGGSVFTFEVSCLPGLSLVAEYSTNLVAGSWKTLCTTNTTNSCVRFSDNRSLTNKQQFYRVRTGP